MNIFFGNLNYKVSEDDLQSLLEEYGEVSSAKVIMDRETGRSKGFGFAEMEDDEAATQAIKQLNGTDLFGRSVVVNEARPREERPQRRRF